MAAACGLVSLDCPLNCDSESCFEGLMIRGETVDCIRASPEPIGARRERRDQADSGRRASRLAVRVCEEWFVADPGVPIGRVSAPDASNRQFKGDCHALRFTGVAEGRAVAGGSRAVDDPVRAVRLAEAERLSGTVAYMASTGNPAPELAAAIAVAVELAGGLLIAIGFYTRPLALVFAAYTLATALIGHRYWALQDGAIHGDDQLLQEREHHRRAAVARTDRAGRYSLDRK